MKLISEHIEDVNYIVEETEGKKNYYIKGIFMQAEMCNRNGRRYKLPVMEREVERYQKEYIDTNRAVGELGHPDGPSIHLERISHKIISLEQDGNNFIGKALIVETPMGKIARNLLESGVQLGVSSRGMGSIKEVEGVMEVQEDFFLATPADIVADPSAPDAFVQGIMEGVEWLMDPDTGLYRKVMIEKAEQLKARATKLTARQVEEQKLTMFEDFVTALSAHK
jgi:hypothetical protein